MDSVSAAGGRAAIYATAAAFAWSVALLVAAYVLLAYGSSGSAPASSTVTLVGVNGAATVVPLVALPAAATIVVAGALYWARARASGLARIVAWVAVDLFGAYCFVTAFISLGIYFVPVAVLLWYATSRTSRQSSGAALS